MYHIAFDGRKVAEDESTAWCQRALSAEAERESWREMYHIAFDGTVVATSTETILKSAAETNNSIRFIGYDINSPTFYLGGKRFTRNTRRYLTNAQGESLNTFTPDAYPFADF
jgi:hypothetical protein